MVGARSSPAGLLPDRPSGTRWNPIVRRSGSMASKTRYPTGAGIRVLAYVKSRPSWLFTNVANTTGPVPVLIGTGGSA